MSNQDLDKAIERATVGLQAEADQLDATLVDDLVSDSAFRRFILTIRAVNQNPEALRALPARDLEVVAYLFSRSAVPIINAVRERRKELGQ